MRQLPKRLHATVNGQRLRYVRSGRGRATIVLINGAGGPIEGWYRLYPAVEELGTVVAYDRPGVGGSARADVPQTGAIAVQSLRGLLAAISVEAPYLLVAHSFGGLHANLFARLHPSEIGGVVFIEATAPQDVGLMKQHRTAMQGIAQTLLGVFSRPDANDEVRHEAETVRQLHSAPVFPPVPLTVVTGGRTPPRWMASAEAVRLRAEHQKMLVQLSPRGRQIIATASGHFPQMSQPDVVLAAIAQTLPT